MRLSFLSLIAFAIWLCPISASALSCPAGYQELKSAGTDFGCIQTATNSGLDWAAADAACFLEGARLPTAQETRSAQTNLTIAAPPFTIGLGLMEWTSESGTAGPDMTILTFDEFQHQGFSNSTAVPYRCFKPAQGHQLSVLPTGPWWLTITLLATGIALQWNYFRKRRTTS